MADVIRTIDRSVVFETDTERTSEFTTLFPRTTSTETTNSRSVEFNGS